MLASHLVDARTRVSPPSQSGQAQDGPDWKGSVWGSVVCLLIQNPVCRASIGWAWAQR